jgi:hypothetical protein
MVIKTPSSLVQARVCSIMPFGRQSERIFAAALAAKRVSLSSLLMGRFPRWNVRHPADKLQKSR